MENLYSYKTIFTLNSQSSLDDFWSYLIFRLNLEQSEYTYDRFARLYNFLSDYKQDLSSEKSITISLQESSQKYFISIDTSLKTFLNAFTHRLTKLTFEYVYEGTNLSYFIDKKSYIKESSPTISSKKKLFTYSFMNETDLEEMLNILEKMQEKNYEQIYPSMDIVEITDYRSTFSYYSSYLRYYSELSTVNNIVAELSVILSLYSKECLLIGNDFRILLKSFLNNLLHWQDKLFIQKNEQINFMDDSLQADISQIKIVLNLYDESFDNNDGESLDDIFDF